MALSGVLEVVADRGENLAALGQRQGPLLGLMRSLQLAHQHVHARAIVSFHPVLVGCVAQRQQGAAIRCLADVRREVAFFGGGDGCGQAHRGFFQPDGLTAGGNNRAGDPAPVWLETGPVLARFRGIPI